MTRELALGGGTAAGPQHGVDWQQAVETYGGHVERCVGAVARRFGWRARAEEIEDLSQEVWFGLVERATPGSPDWWRWPAPRARAYLGRTAHNAVVDALRRGGAAKRGGARQRPTQESPVEELERARDPADDPESRLLAREQGAELWRRLAGLLDGRRAPRDAQILVLSVVDGWTPDEIAHRLGGALAAGSVYSVLHRARGALARQGRAHLEWALGLAEGHHPGRRPPSAASCATAR